MTERRLRDRYELLSSLGESEYAVTHLARDHETGQDCVVKSLRFRRVEEWKTIELFEREVLVLKNLDHPRIPRFLEAFTTEDDEGKVMHLVQTFVPGRDLGRRVRDGERFPEARVRAIARDVAEVLDYLHALSPPVIHRDIKPSNVVVGDDGRAHLIDFGAARDRLLREWEPVVGGPTIVGTYGYMPYEQFAGHAVPASDLYSLGATLIFCLSHREPAEMERKAMRLDFAPYVQVSAPLREILARLIEPNWEDRYRSAHELLEALDSVDRQPVEGDTAALESPGGPHPARRRVTGTGQSLVFAGVWLVLAVLAFWQLRSPGEAPLPESSRATPQIAAPASAAQGPSSPPPVKPVGGALHVDIYRDFAYQPSGWPMAVPVGQTEARGTDTEPLEALRAEPDYASPEVLYGYIALGNGPDTKYTFVVDQREQPTWVLWFDRNNDEDLTDDGPPLPNRGTGKLGVNLTAEVEIVTRDGRVLRQPYHLWLWMNDGSSTSQFIRPFSAKFYGVCHYAGRVELADHVFKAVAFEEQNHDALFAESGLWIDWNGDGKLDRHTERYLHGERLRLGDQSWVLSLDYP